MRLSPDCDTLYILTGDKLIEYDLKTNLYAVIFQSNGKKLFLHFDVNHDN